MGGKKGGNTGTPVVEYHLSSHLGICLGPVDNIHTLTFKDKRLGEDLIYREGMAKIDIDQRELFGGPKKEGGVHGSVWFLPGHPDQIMPAELAARLYDGGLPESVPGFRGIASIFLTGNGWNNQPGFYQGSQMPQVIVPEVRVSKSCRMLDTPYYAPPDPAGEFWRRNVNPSSALFEMFCDSEWGMGASQWSFDIPSFQRAAERLYNESFGITIYQGTQFKIEDLASDILDHIDGMFFFNPQNGLGTLKLLRDDYNVNTLDTIGPHNARMINFRRKLWGETVNEIVVEWINPENEETETVAYQNLANIAMQGEVVSETKQYHFLRHHELASAIAARDLSRASQPLATAQIEVMRDSWKRLPGDVVKFTWPKYEIQELVMRVMEVDYGNVGDAKIKITLMEDIFGLSYASYVDVPRSEWEEPGTPPEPLEVKIISTPKPVIDRFYDLTDDMYPAITPAFLAWSPSYDFNTFDLMVYDMQVDRTMGWTGLGTRSTIGKTSTVAAMVQEVISEVEITRTIGGLSPTPASIGVIGEGDDYTDELVMFLRDVTEDYPDTPDGNAVWSVLRGLWDTVPQEWPEGTVVRVLTEFFNAMDFSERLAFTDIDYKLLTISNKGKLDLDDAPTETANVCDRPHLPFRPANVVIDGVMFGTVDWSEDVGVRKTEATVTWANRHRNTEDAVPRHWDDGEMAPEDSQTTEIVFLDMNMNELGRIAGLTGTSYTFPLSFFNVPGEDEGFVKLVSRRDGLEFLQGITLRLKFQPRGFGYDYGYGYGGWIGWEGQGG